MKKATKIAHPNASKKLRKSLHDLDRSRPERLIQNDTVPKPKFVTQTDGKVVAHTGP